MIPNIRATRQQATRTHIMRNVLIVLSLFFTTALLAGGPIFNDGFEGKMLWNTKALTSGMDASIRRSGGQSFRLALEDAAKIRSAYAYVWLWNLQSLRYYRLTFYYRAAGLTGTKLFKLSLDAKAAGKSIGLVGNFEPPIPVDAAWHKFTCDFRMPRNESPMVVQLVLNQFATGGTLHLDDVKVEEIGEGADIPKTNAEKPDWKNIPPMTHFYNVQQSGSPAQAETSVQMTYDDRNFYVRFKNEEPEMARTKFVGDTPETQGIWKGECNDLFIAAPNGMVLQFLANANGGRLDGRLYRKAAGDPWRFDSSWNGKWEAKGTTAEDSWTTEYIIPFSNFNMSPAAGQIWKFNFGRERHIGTPEFSQWNRSGDSFSNANFFATLKFDTDSAKALRFTEPVAEFSFTPVRDTPKCVELQKKSGAFLKSFYHGAGNPPETLEKRMKEYGDSGVTAYMLPWFPQQGREYLIKLLKENNTRAMIWVHNSDRIRDAKRFGSVLYMDPTTPEYTRGAVEFLEHFLADKELLSHVELIYGKDEPENELGIYSMSAYPEYKAELEKISGIIRKNYGYGKYGLYDVNGPITPERPFERIAFMRYWNDCFRKSYLEQYEAVKRLAPGVNYIGANLNNCGYMSPIDAATGGEIGSWLGIDAYPGSARNNGGMARAVYHIGYTVKFNRDLAHGTPILGLIQCFVYGGVTPTPAMLREWTSQALKNGAVRVFFWGEGPADTQIPETYREMLRLAKIMGKTRELVLPEKTSTAIFFSYPTMWGLDDNLGHAHYSIYAILGEKLKSNFRFIANTSLERGYDKLENYKLLYLPRLTYTDASTASKIIDYVKNGGRAVIFDPDLFMWNLDGVPLAKEREQLMGSMPGKKREADKIRLTRPIFGLSVGCELGLAPERNLPNFSGVRACNLTVPADGEVFAVYPDGKPAGYTRKLGKGEVVVFGAQPFGDSRMGLVPGNWETFFRHNALQAGEKLDLPIWDFMLPEKGL